MASLLELESGALVGARELRLQADLLAAPPALLDLASSLEILDLSGNHLSSLPSWFPKLEKLRILFLSFNRFQDFPEILGRMPNLEMIGFKSNEIRSIPDSALPPSLRWLILTDNRLAELPRSLGGLSRLQKLMLAGNRLESLPDLSGCEKLQLVRLSANQLDALPDSLLSLPELAWIAWSGNPFCRPRTSSSASVHWEDLTLEGRLGQGASGVIHQAIWNPGKGAAKDVAVKIFKGEVTSDGYPEDEREATLAAGVHPHLVPVLGKLENHPTGSQGLVMDRIAPTWSTLGHPPSFESCTRDTYPPGTAFPASFRTRVLEGVESMLAHIHGRGILHGDLYAHNILVDRDGYPLIGDFGASGFLEDLPPHQQALALAAERRAFHHLADDLSRVW